jgi:hypothetical protein
MMPHQESASETAPRSIYDPGGQHRRVVDLHKPGQLGGIGIRLPRLQTRRNLISAQFVTTQIACI